MNRSIRRSVPVAFATAAAIGLTLAGCSAPAGPSEPSGPITMWTRDVTATQSQALVDAWNADNEQQIELTVIPQADYLQKIGVAAGANELPCLMASDVVYAPNFIDKNLLVDITDRVQSLDFADALAPGHISVSTADDKIYAVPHTLAMSAIFQNNVLLEQAGIDPDEPLESLAQLNENALKVAALGPDITGFLFTSDSAGTLSFTLFPSIWAAGGGALSDDGLESNLDSQDAIDVFTAYNTMAKDGSAPTAETATGATRNDVFATGTVGYVLASNSVLQAVPDSDTVKVGVQAIPGPDGGQSTFLGGDVMGISVSCDNPDGAWDFLSWTLGDDAQAIYGGLNQLSVRSDISDSANPNIAKLTSIIPDGQTPFALRYAETFNDPQGPALAMFREALFGDDPAGALESGNQSITDSLQQ